MAEWSCSVYGENKYDYFEVVSKKIMSVNFHFSKVLYIWYDRLN